MNLAELFESIELHLLQEWVAERRQEDLYLDFKTLPSAPDLTRDDRKNFAIALSGFSNSDGGVIVWGIDARPSPGSKVDCAQELRPVADAAGVLSRLQSLTGEATSPLIDHIEHRLISHTNGTGFLVTLIPVSDSGPHMALLGEGRYYKRSGDSFYRLEHFDVADMFGRRPQPQLELVLTCERGGSTLGPSGRSVNLHVIPGLANKGKGIAKYPLVELNPHPPYRIAEFELDGNGTPGLPRRAATPTRPTWQRYAGGLDHAVHPGDVLDITLIKVPIAEGSP